MISAHTGLPGSGKTLTAVAYRILPALRQGRPVVTNVPLNLDEIARRYPRASVELIDLADFAIDNPERRSFADIEGGTLLVLDELWRLWPSGLKTANIPEDHKALLAEHRHRVGSNGRTMDILLITQDLGQVAAFARQLVDKTAITTKLDALGMRNRSRMDMYHGPVQGQEGPKARHIRSSVIKYPREVFSLYKSHTQSESDEPGQEINEDSRALVWKSPLFVFLALAIVFVVPWAVGAVTQAISPEEWAEEPLPVATATPGPVAVVQSVPKATPGPTPEPTPEPPKYSQHWRLVGSVENLDSGTGYAVVKATRGYIRLELDACERMPGSVDMQCEHLGEWVHVATGTGYLSGVRVNGAQ